MWAVEVVAQAQSIMGFQRHQSCIDQLLVRRVYHEIYVVVPRYAAMVSVRAEKCPTNHEVCNVQPVQLTQQSAQGEVQRTKISVGHRRREQEIQIVDEVPVNKEEDAYCHYSKSEKQVAKLPMPLLGTLY